MRQKTSLFAYLNGRGAAEEEQQDGSPPATRMRGKIFRRGRAESSHSRRDLVFQIADKRADGLKHKTRGKAPRRIYVPLRQKADKLARRAS